MDLKGTHMLPILKTTVTFISIISLSACMSTGPEFSGPIAKIDNQKWRDSGAWASGNPTWAYDVLEVYKADTMKRIYKKTFFELSTRIDLPPGEYIVHSKCYWNTRKAAPAELYVHQNKHKVTLEADKTLTFDFAEASQSACSLSPRLFNS